MSPQNFKLLEHRVDPAPLLAALTEHPELWKQGQRETHQGSPHAQVSSIMLRWWESSEAAALDIAESVDYPAAKILMPAGGEAMMSVLDQLGVIGNIGHVMITRVPPGATIAKHMDEGVYAELHDRFHVCLQGDAGNLFISGGETIHPMPGDAFWFHHKREHEVRNEGAIDRIHLIVDVMAPEFTRLRGIYYQCERVSNLWVESEPLLQKHWQEITHYKDIQLDPDQEAYHALELAGKLRCYTVRDSAKLVGYVAFIVAPNLHYRGSLQAHQDVLFVLPEYRLGMTGVRLIKYAEQRLAAEGVQLVYHHAKRTNKVGGLLERLGYELVDMVYAKRLDKE